MLPPPAVAPSRSRVSSREKDAIQGMKYEGVIDWLHYSPGPRMEQSRFTSVSVGDMYWRIVSPIRSQELVRHPRTWAPRTTAGCEDGAGLRGRGAASRHACAHAHVRTHAHALAPAHSLSPVAQTLHRNAANLLKEHGPFSHIRKASAVPPKVPKLNADGERPPNSKAPTERVLYTDDFGEEFEVGLPLPSLPSVGGDSGPSIRTMHMPCICHACAIPCAMPCAR